MKEAIFEIRENKKIARNTYEMVLAGDTTAIAKPGQFVNLKLEGFFLRRPISVCDYETGSAHRDGRGAAEQAPAGSAAQGRLTLVYKAVGEGTEKMAALGAGTQLSVLTGLGNGYAQEKAGDAPVLIGGGAGIPPMHALCKALMASGGKKVQVILGFNTKDEIFYQEKFEALGAEVHVATADGSVGEKGFVTDVLAKLEYTYFYACGPLPMLRAIEKTAKSDGEYSFEERMGCGFGACMGCSMKMADGSYKRVCKEGPVFGREEIAW